MYEGKRQQDNYVIKFVLTNFIGARYAQVENEDGEMEECVCIPLLRNNLKKNGRNQTCAYAFMSLSSTPNQYGWTHYLKMKQDPNFVKKINELGLKSPYIGNAKKDNYIVYKKDYQAKYVKVNNDE
jgi:hypothetical protein